VNLRYFYATKVKTVLLNFIYHYGKILFPIKEEEMKLLIIALVLCGSIVARAEEKMGKDHPCKNLKAACEAAGFAKGKHKEGKGLWMDCLNKLKAGEAVPGVTAAPGEVDACKAKMEAHHKSAK
jgi:hypothetical protein